MQQQESEQSSSVQHQLLSETANSQKIDNLLSWLTECGATGLDSIQVKPSPACDGSLGCFTLIPRKQGEIIASIPRKCMFALGEALNSPITEQLLAFEKSIENTTHVMTNEFILQVYMSQCLLETNDAHRQRWQPYLQSLPSEPPLVSNWSDEVLSTIQSTNLGVAVATEKQLLAEQLEFLKQFNETHPGVLHENIGQYITWSKGNYLSRRFVGRLAINGEGKGEEAYGGKIGCLLPFFDLLNHQNGFNVKFEMDELCVSYVTSSTLEAGDELFNNYCSMSNEELLFTYGFAVKNNPLDSLTLKLVTQQKQSKKSSKKKAKKNLKNDAQTTAPLQTTNVNYFQVLPTAQGGIPTELFQALIGSADIQDIYPEEVDMVLRMIVSKDNLVTNAISLLDEEIKRDPKNVQLEYLSLYLKGQKTITVDTIASLNEMKTEATTKHGMSYH